MKFRTTHLSALLAVLSFIGCSGVAEEPVSQEIEAAVVGLASPVADALASTLVSNLTRAMRDRGPVAAVEFCSTMAQDLTGDVQEAQGLALKRTSFRYRNPANAPDEDETKALHHFEEVLAQTGALPGHWVQKASREEYRYYRPLSVTQPCLSCHGAESEIDPQVRAVLAERYPDDLATGYGTGDFRGLIRVSIPVERVEAGD